MKNRLSFSLLALLGWSFLGCGHKHNDSDTQDVSVETPKAECSVVLNGVKTQDVDVMLCNKSLNCSGSIFGKGGFYKKEDTLFLVTAAHMFSVGYKGFYYYVIVNQDTLYASKLIKTVGDATIVQLSTKKEPYLQENFADINLGIVKGEEMTFFPFYEGIYFTTICGDNFLALGILKYAHRKYESVVIDWQSRKGLSGTVFTDTLGNMYVLSNGMVLDIPGQPKGKEYTLIQEVHF